jgi:aspartyl-tRNA(Asn)/glutamyl-tRNA(Gln) amidotransferase subunit A
VGTDTAGSIRIPANLCGVAGLKPTTRAVSTAGVIALSPSLDVVGPMAHHPDDLGVLMSAMSRDRSFDQTWDRARTVMQEHRANTTLRVGVVRDTGPLTPGSLAAFESAIDAAGTFGPITDVVIEEFLTSVFTDFTILGVEAVAVHRQWSAQLDRYTPYVRERLQQAAETRALDYVDALAAAARLRRTVDHLMAGLDVLVLPGVPFPAPHCGVTEVDIAGHLEDRDTAMCRNTAFANVTGHPALALPVSFENDMPVGIQLVARRGDDAFLLAVGAALADELETPTLAPAFRHG